MRDIDCKGCHGFGWIYSLLLGWIKCTYCFRSSNEELTMKKCIDEYCKMCAKNCDGLKYGQIKCCFHAFGLVSDKNCNKCSSSLLRAIGDIVSSN